uniref:Uncharacterized protein n=1 Tax=Avena sativa TaxID=4498 RepID=A0ACD5Z033_AVESA
MMMPETVGEARGHDLRHYGLPLSVVVGIVVAGPVFMVDGGDAILEAVAELFGPVGLLLLPVSLILLIRILSSGHRLVDVFGFALGESLDAAQRAGRGSPAGAALALLLFLLVVYYRSSSLFGGDDDE